MFSYETTATGANIVLGGYNATHFKGNLTAVKSQSDSYWNTTLSKLDFGGVNLYSNSASSVSQVWF
jgi:hypothetical protein